MQHTGSQTAVISFLVVTVVAWQAGHYLSRCTGIWLFFPTALVSENKQIPIVRVNLDFCKFPSKYEI